MVKAFVVGLAALVMAGCANQDNPKTPWQFVYHNSQNSQPELSVKAKKNPRYIIPDDSPNLEKKVKEKKAGFFDTLTPEYKALLDTISYAEYTSPPCLGEISSYQVLVLGKIVKDPHHRFAGRHQQGKCRVQYFKGYLDHPKIKVGFSADSKITSDAAGRYQFMGFTYDRLKKLQNCGPYKDQDCKLFERGFTPDEQDEAAVFMIKVENKVTQEMLEKAVTDDSFKNIWKKLAKTWASLPYYDFNEVAVGYYPGQRNAKSFKDLKKFYLHAFYKYRKEQSGPGNIFYNPSHNVAASFLQGSSCS